VLFNISKRVCSVCCLRQITIKRNRRLYDNVSRWTLWPTEGDQEWGALDGLAVRGTPHTGDIRFLQGADSTSELVGQEDLRAPILYYCGEVWEAYLRHKGNYGSGQTHPRRRFERCRRLKPMYDM